MVTASWHDERDLLFKWMLPNSLEPYADQVNLEVKFGQESDWIKVARGQRTQMDLNPYMVCQLLYNVLVHPVINFPLTESCN